MARRGRARGGRGAHLGGKNAHEARNAPIVDDAAQTNLIEVQEEFNETLRERFSSRQKFSNPQTPIRAPPQIRASHRIRDYLANSNNNDSTHAGNHTWLSKPEFPTEAEILDSSSEPDLPVNIVLGPWPSKEEYLSTHYELFRADAIQPLREAVSQVRRAPEGKEASFEQVGFYDHVRMTAVTFSTRGIAVKVTFSLNRVGKRIYWDQSKRLIVGGLVALSPADDMFKSICRIATVAARPKDGLERDPPEVDLFFARADTIEIDPSTKWVMVEDRSSLFEASRSTLLALQRLYRETFPLSQQIVSTQKEVHAPQWLQEKPEMNLSAIFSSDEGREEYNSVNVLQAWPDTPGTELDKSQLTALHHILTKCLAIVQGPPGTGKTHVSVVALKALLSNMTYEDPPIIVACQTNHAVDQLLRLVAVFEPSFLRLGGRSKDLDVIKKRTLYEVRNTERKPDLLGSIKVPSIKAMEALERQMKTLLEPLNAMRKGHGPFDAKVLWELGLLQQGQYASLVEGASTMPGTTSDNPIESWLGHSLVSVQRDIILNDFGFEYEDADLEFEQLKEIEAEVGVNSDEEFDGLRGSVLQIADNFTCRLECEYSDRIALNELKKGNLWDVAQIRRGAVYRYLQKEVKARITNSFRRFAVPYDAHARNRMTGHWEEDLLILQRQKIIGMTLTGFSKYRALISALDPRIVLVEEAAETLEAPVVATCIPSLEHLILVGDHQQLRPRCQTRFFEGEPFNMDISLFERLVYNDLPYAMLKRQRRMIPEIRRLLRPIYGKLLTDHPSVKDTEVRPDVPGMGGINTYFFTHDWTEGKDDQRSAVNTAEVLMITGFFDYLVSNGLDLDQITVLTFYNGQRKAILGGLRSHPKLKGNVFKVVTVDSYQGEENDVVLLSLVRSNPEMNIGFLKNINRVCVALSRAKRGFYLFGNGLQLCCESGIWAAVVETMYGDRDTPSTRRVGYRLPLTCTNHGRKTWVEHSTDWDVVNGGGCGRTCRGTLPCGHDCTLKCHPYPHEAINCLQKCRRRVESCGHPCDAACGDQCRCTACKATDSTPTVLRPSPFPATRSKPPQRHAQSLKPALENKPAWATTAGPSPQNSNKSSTDYPQLPPPRQARQSIAQAAQVSLKIVQGRLKLPMNRSNARATQNPPQVLPKSTKTPKSKPTSASTSSAHNSTQTPARPPEAAKPELYFPASRADDPSRATTPSQSSLRRHSPTKTQSSSSQARAPTVATPQNSPSRQSNGSDSAAWRLFSNGGYREDDKARVEQQTTKAQQAAVDRSEAERRKLDEENMRALFDDMSCPVWKTERVKPSKQQPQGTWYRKGGRQRWAETASASQNTLRREDEPLISLLDWANE